jgi:hypothetical protein
MDLLLYPIPRSLTYTAGTVPLDAPVQRVLDPAIVGDEAYRVTIDAGLVRLTGRTATGLRWAEVTLAQIRAQCSQALPCLVIEDAPAFAHRSFMLDISRDRVPTLKTLQELVDTIVSLKGNRLQLYVEHTLAYRGHEDVWRSASPLTLEELAALNAYCTARGVALDANQNCLGHVERWLRVPRYAHLGELQQSRMHNGTWHVEPNTLCPTDPRAFALVEDLLRQQLPVVSGAYANIGCDEPWDLGHGRSQAECARDGRGRVFSRWVSQVAKLTQDLGKIPQYWCDPHPNEDDGLPRDVVALVWGYGHEEDFATRTAAHRAAGREVWVCPGTGSWNSTIGRTWCRRPNFARAAAQAGSATGYLITEWGDNGHLQPWPVTLVGLADGLQAAWSGSDRFDDRALGQTLFANPAVGEWFSRLGDADETLSRRGGNSNATHRDMNYHFADPASAGTQAEWREAGDRLRTLIASAPAGWWRDEAVLGARIAEWGADRGAIRLKGGFPSNDDRQHLAQRIPDLVAAHRQQWLQRCGYGGLEDSCARLRIHATRW